MGHLCVKSTGQIFATLGFDAHIGSHFSGFFAGLHSEDRAMSEKMPKMSGQRVRLPGLMADSVMTELVVTAKYMKRGGEQEGQVSAVVIPVAPAVAVAEAVATAPTVCVTVAIHPEDKEVGEASD